MPGLMQTRQHLKLLHLPADAMELFRPYAEAGREIVCFSISAGMSTSGNVMRLAAEELGASDRIKVIDSANLSTGIGLLVVEAAIMARITGQLPRLFLR